MEWSAARRSEDWSRSACAICGSLPTIGIVPVDDRPFGGGEGMVLKAEPLSEALDGLGVKPFGGTQ